MIAGWKYIDHAAHLGGLLFGILWMKEGMKLMDPMIKSWHEYRQTWK